MNTPWQLDATCAGTQPDMWEPAAQGSPMPAVLKDICRGCPVRDHCLDDALTHGDSGYRGGTTEIERRRMGARRRTLRRGKAAHTYQGSSRQRAAS